MATSLRLAPARCSSCTSPIPGGALSCPQCHALVHADRLKDIAAKASDAAAHADFASERILWSEALALLPVESAQHRAITAKLASAPNAPAAEPAKPAHPLRRLWGGITGAVAILLSKLKLVLLGLAKLPTLLSMAAFILVYLQQYGWMFAVGFVACIYIHEMGHVHALRREGMPATSPIFIPGFGALVMLKSHPVDEHQDARIGLAGPVWGAAAAVIAAVLFVATGAHIWSAIAESAAFLNLFNLLPIWQLDGGRAFNAMSRTQRIVVTVALSLLAYVAQSKITVLLAIGAAFRCVFWLGDTEDNSALNTYLLLAIGLNALSWWLTHQ